MEQQSEIQILETNSSIECQTKILSIFKAKTVTIAYGTIQFPMDMITTNQTDIRIP